MKKRYNIIWKSLALLGVAAAVLIGCEREISDDAVEALFSDNPDVFIDSFSSGLEYLPFGGSKQDAFTVDTETVFEGSASMRFDVPNVGDPDGAFAGAIFPDLNGGRNLTKYDALTFYAKATTAGTINEIGFGQDFGEARYLVTRLNLRLTTNWRKYVIPIPDPSVLTQESGLLWYSEGPEDGDGYTFWLDNVQFEKLGTVAQPRPSILNGQDLAQQSFISSSLTIDGLGQTFNTANGQDVTVIPAPAYFDFRSSDPSVAAVDEQGRVTVVSAGTAIITASLNGVDATGSLNIESVGAFPHAPVPTRPASNVTSLFSDAYENVPVRHYNGFFAPFQTTQGGAGSDPNNVDIQAPFADGSLDNIINYTQLNFVSIGMYETVPNVDVSSRTTFHVDINVRETVNNGDFIRIELETGTGSGQVSGSSFTISAAMLRNVDDDGWASIDIPLSSFSGFNNRSRLGQVFFISDNTISNIWVDNVYFYNQ
ncbi:hypothetical protein BST86_01050 [Nonlabens agnitus]|uniref:BIG2 domain-containing protein n=2 Tax=Nonlabens agnitus TaxID=870484 RepID=A0A2S9WQP3_9FLAO|nr:hypothetical protein BST86_01050 [Nonlabens agnitus]